ncbi:hypothetical protein MBLNU459_g3547t1 [Dothideomycetes sp. NU459]
MAPVSQKRKRDSMDHEGPNVPAEFRASPNDGTLDFESHYVQHPHENDMPAHFAESLLQHNAGDHGMHVPVSGNGQSASDTASAALHYSMTVPQATEESFLEQASRESHRDSSTAFNLGDGPQQDPNSYGDFSSLEQLKDPSQQPTEAPVVAVTEGSPSSEQTSNKPAVGTDQWHKVRRDNHKEVERRRRETINEGINELAKIVPNCEKNKGSILQRAVIFITQLKENESQNIEKWTLEKLLTEQAIAELSSSCDKLKAEVNRNYKELEAWKRCAQRAGVEPTVEDRAAVAGSDGDE